MEEPSPSPIPWQQRSLGQHRWLHNQFPPLSSVLHCPLGLGKLHACPFVDVVSQPLPLSALSSSPFYCALQVYFGQTWWTGDMSIPLQFAFLYDGQEVFVWSDCLPGSSHRLPRGLNVLCVVFFFFFSVAPHFHGLYSSLELCCDGSWFTSIQEDKRDKGSVVSWNLPRILGTF